VRNVAAIVALVVTACVVAACGSSGSKSASTSTTGTTGASGVAGKKVAVVFPADPNVAYLFDVACGIREEAKRVGLDVMEPQGPKQAIDVAGQAQVLQSVMANNPDALLYDPADPKAGSVGIKAAVAGGLPVVDIDTQLSDPSLYISFSASSQEGGGKVGGDLLAKQIGGSGKVAAIGTLPDNPITIGRIKGFQEAVAKYPGVKVVSTSYPPFDVNKFAAEAAAILAKNPDLKGFYTTNDTEATGVATALRDAHLTGKVKLVTWDVQPDVVNMLKSGVVTGTVGQYPRLVGRMAIQQLVNHFTGKPVQKVVAPPNIVVTPETLNDPKIQAFVNANYSTTSCS
jgi:ribose transport system substrate-binding protein